MDKFLNSLLAGCNNPPEGTVVFDSSDHIRFQNGQNWQNNVQMAPKRMRIVKVDNNIVQLRGYGFDMMGASFADYGVSLLIENDVISRVQLNMYDRNISIVYL